VCQTENHALLVQHPTVGWEPPSGSCRFRECQGGVAPGGNGWSTRW